LKCSVLIIADEAGNLPGEDRSFDKRQHKVRRCYLVTPMSTPTI
jgi:hypothetical protein